MSFPPGTPDPNDPDGSRGRDPWATPTGDEPTRQQPTYPPQQPDPYAQQPGQYGQPAYGQPYDYGQQYGQQYGQPGYGQPTPYGYGAPSRTNGKATAALWTGIGSLVLSFCCGLGVLGILPIVLGVKARAEIRATGGQQEGDGMATAGIITGAVALVLSIAFIVLIVVAIVSGRANFDSSSPTGV